MCHLQRETKKGSKMEIKKQPNEEKNAIFGKAIQNPLIDPLD